MTNATETYRAARDLLVRLGDDLPAAVEQFAWPRFEGPFNWVCDWFDQIAAGNDAAALVVVSEDGSHVTHSFDELHRRSLAVSARLRQWGVGVGDSVIVMLGNQVELWESMLAVMRLGAVVMPTTTAVGPVELIDRIDRGGAVAVICGVGDTATIDQVPGEFLRICVGAQPEGWLKYSQETTADDAPLTHPGTRADDRLLLYFTSGTTSRPKLVEHTQSSYPVGHLSTMYWLGLRPGDVHLNISSPGWAKHAWSSLFAPWIAEATIVVLNYTKFEPQSMIDRLHQHRVTTFCAPPTVWRMLVNSDLSGGPGHLRELVAAGEPLNPEVISQIERAWSLTIRDGFGQTEMTAAIGNTPGARVKPGSMGRPLPGVPVVLVDPITGQVRDDEGEICIDARGCRPVPLMTGYLGDPDRNAEAHAGGFYRTGDLATRDQEGYLTYVGRTDDVFKSSDYKVSPFELESVLIEHPAVAEAAVVPAPDPVRLSVPKAYVALAPGHEPSAELAEDILMFARERLPRYLRVRRLEFFDLPKTISGKIRRVELRSREESAERFAGEWRLEDFGVRQA